MLINTYSKIWLVAFVCLFWATPVWADDIDSLRKGYDICRRHLNLRPGIAGCADSYEWAECNEIVDRWHTLIYGSANKAMSKKPPAGSPDEADLAIITKTLGIQSHTAPQ